MPRRSTKVTKEKTTPLSSYWDQISKEVQSNQSKLSLVLGALIILVVGVLIFNYFNKNKADLGPAQQTQQQQEDVSPDKLPGKYTVREGDTLFTIAEKYYQDGNKFTEIAKANNLENVDMVETGQVLEIPKLEAIAEASSQPSAEPTSSPTPETSTQLTNTTIWGPRIEENIYTVQEGDWLSKIADRAYGDVMAYQKIAQANNIANPDLIYPGQVLTIPR